MKAKHDLGRASGKSLEDCHVLCYRRDARRSFSPYEDESYVIQVAGDVPVCIFGGQGWLTGLWRSPTGRVYLSASTSGAFVSKDSGSVAAGVFDNYPIGGCAGIWGLDDSFAVAWGGGFKNPPHMHRWDGGTWQPMPPPPAVVVDVHGVAPDLLYAVGMDGLIARWDGKAWTRVPSSVTWTISGIHVAGPDEMYAVGHGAGVLVGSAYGWSEVLRARGPVTCVSKYQEDVYVGATFEGLSVTLVPLRPDLQASGFDARSGLLVSSPTDVAFSTDGNAFVTRDATTLGRCVEPWRASKR